jgi:sugar lactone lactonase YvrE
MFFLLETSTFKSNIHHNTRWMQNGFTVAGGNGKGSQLNQLQLPYSIYVDDNQTIYVADYGNNRIVEWRCGATNGQIVAGGSEKGNRTNQLNRPTDLTVDKERDDLIICDYGNRRIMRWPRQYGINGQIMIANIDCNGLIMDNNGYLYVSDYRRDEVRRWKINDTYGTLVAGGNGKGNHLNQLDNPTFIFIGEDHSIYVSDWNNDRVMKWVEGVQEGTVVVGGQSEGDTLSQLPGPHGLIVDRLGTIYVADCNKHRIMRWFKGDSTKGNIVIGGNGMGERANQLNCPEGLSFDQRGNLYVVDSSNSRVQRFNIDRCWKR